MLVFTSKTINFLDAFLYIFFYFSAFIPQVLQDLQQNLKYVLNMYHEASRVNNVYTCLP